MMSKSMTKKKRNETTKQEVLSLLLGRMMLRRTRRQLFKKFKDTEHFFDNFGQSRSTIYYFIRYITWYSFEEIPFA